MRIEKVYRQMMRIGDRNVLVVFIMLLCGVSQTRAQSQDLRMWYDEPAQKWTEALPIGNGSLGGMIFGGIYKERIQLNEESIWTGHPIERGNPAAKSHLDSVRRLLFDGRYAEAEKMAQEKIMGKRLPGGTHTYQTLGNLYLNFGDSTKVQHYRRELDLSRSLAKVEYQKDGVRYQRELFSSYPDQLVAIKISADQQGALSFGLQLNRPGPGEEVTVKNNGIVMREHVGGGDGVRYTTRLRLKSSGGSLVTTDSTLNVHNANKAIILMTAATDYRGGNPDTITKNRLQKAEIYSYKELKRRHTEDYQKLFNRVSLDLTPQKVHSLATDERIETVKEGREDPHLTELYFQYGRYLLISSSRPGSLPANLQGIWAEGMSPPWNADYHSNINLQMNYWPADVTNLSETLLPYFDFVEDLNKRGAQTARETYGSRGMVVHHTTDVWHFTDPIGKTYWGLWPMGGAWLARHFWDHYRFSRNRTFLQERAYPQMKRAATFFIDYLVKDPQTGYLVTGPSMSPENQYLTSDGQKASIAMGPTMDMEILHELFGATIQASEKLNIDPAFRDTLRRLKDKLAPVRIGDDGTIMEWNEDFEEADPGHRHISHLYSLHPGDAINAKDTPELFSAARKTIDRRLEHGGGHTGWSRAWIINFFARLKDGEKAHENLLALYRKSTLSNLFDTHPPFQIDGNFGGTAGIAEMLLQSHAEYIELLPALPKAWNTGEVKGLKARGNCTVDMKWTQGLLVEARVISRSGGTVYLRTSSPVKDFDIDLLEEKKLVEESGQTAFEYKIQTKPEDVITFTF